MVRRCQPIVPCWLLIAPLMHLAFDWRSTLVESVQTLLQRSLIRRLLNFLLQLVIHCSSLFALVYLFFDNFDKLFVFLHDLLSFEMNT